MAIAKYTKAEGLRVLELIDQLEDELCLEACPKLLELLEDHKNQVGGILYLHECEFVIYEPDGTTTGKITLPALDSFLRKCGLYVS